MRGNGEGEAEGRIGVEELGKGKERKGGKETGGTSQFLPGLTPLSTTVVGRQSTRKLPD